MLQRLFKSSGYAASLRVDGTDEDFDSIYPRGVRRLSAQHFTPLDVAKKAAAFLVQKPGTRVLDIGSGAGKFCLTAAICTKGHFVGIEQRKELVTMSAAIASSCEIRNVNFIHGNVMTLRFDEFDAFYMYNPFYENSASGKRMDDAVLLSPSLFASYSAYTSAQLANLRAGIKLATYYTSPKLIPETFDLVESSNQGNLLFWQKRT